MRRALFTGFAGRLFLWFWLSLSLLLVANFFLARYLNDHPTLRELNAKEQNHFQRMQRFIERRSGEAEQRLLHDRLGRMLVWFDANSLRPLERERRHWRLQELAAADSPSALELGPGRTVIGPFHLTTAEGALVAVWPMPPRPVPWWHQLLHDSPYWRLGASMLLVLTLSVILARWLSRPIRAISGAARQLGDGNLQARAPDGTGELGQLARDFNTMAGKLAESVTGQQRLLADVSHELRSPLTRLKLAAGLMADRDGNNTYLERINKECDTLDHLVERILTLSRLEGSLYQEQAEVMDLAEQVQRTIRDWRFACPDNRIDYIGPQRLNTPLQPRLLQHVLDNLLSNACRHGRVIKVTVEAPTPGQWQIGVEDDGPGLAPEQQEALFEPFYRGDPARGHGGHIGLGLAIAKAAAEAQHADLTVRSSASGGLRFQLAKRRRD